MKNEKLSSFSVFLSIKSRYTEEEWKLSYMYANIFIYILIQICTCMFNCVICGFICVCDFKVTGQIQYHPSNGQTIEWQGYHPKNKPNKSWNKKKNPSEKETCRKCTAAHDHVTLNGWNKRTSSVRWRDGWWGGF